MATVTKKISLDVSRKNLLPNIIAKQFDTDSRFLTVTLLDEGEPIKAASDSEVIVSFRRKDGHAKSFKGAANGDGTVTVPLANWALELDDIVECDISVYQGEVRLSTTTFRLEVQPAANGSDEISKDENYDVLGQLIVEVSEAIEEASTAASAANTAKAEADAARDKAHTAADNADEKAQLANEAAEAANTAAAEAGKWKNVNVSAKGLAEGAAPTATLTETEDGKAFEFGIPKGDKGDKGDRGEKGEIGPQGATGSQGPAGAAGTDGKDGITPHIGENGNWYIGEVDTEKPSRGEQGPQGLQGLPGEDGAPGAQGPAGAAGTDGKDGFSPTATVSKSGAVTTITITDSKGTTTAKVNDGAKGDKGDKGDAGPQGPTGPQGPQGPKGDDATPSTTVPFPPADTGSVGNESAYARGDHVHPLSNLEVAGKAFTYSDLNDATESGIYAVTAFTNLDNRPLDLYSDWGILIVFRSSRNYLQQIIILNGYYSNIMWTRSGWENNSWSSWDRIPRLMDVSASNFSGILPVGKGGTGRSDGYSLGVKDARSGLLIKFLWNGDTTQEAEGGQTLYPIIGIPESKISGGIGYAAVANRYFKEKLDIASNSNTMATQLALASLYESRSVSTASADAPLESPSIDGELSALDQNMIKVYADLCLNPDSGKSVDDVPENLRSHVSAIVEQTLTERKEAEERYKAEMAEREAEERRKAEEEAEEKAKAEAEAAEGGSEQTSPESEESEDTSPADTGNDEKEEP